MIDFIRLFKRIDNHRLFLEREDIKFVEGIIYKNQRHIKYAWHNDLKTSCKIKVGYNNWIEFAGSITKYWYEENYTNLPYSDLVCAVYELADTLYSYPNDLILRSFEFGLNILLDDTIKVLNLTDLAFNYKNKFFQDMDGDNLATIGKRCVLQEYQLKLYSKSMQYKLPYELLRYEIKVHKKRILYPYNFHTFDSLLNKNNLIFLKEQLIEKLSEVLFYDNTIPKHLLTNYERQLCANWQSGIYRKNLLKTNRQKFNYQKKRLLETIDKYGELHLKPNLIQQVSDTWDNLLES